MNGAIELVRQQKQVGTSLEARVLLKADGELFDLLNEYRGDLPMLFIVSAVDLERLAGAAADDVEVTVTRADGTRCVRCWRYVPAVAPDDEHHAGLCDRCVEAVREPAEPPAR